MRPVDKKITTLAACLMIFGLWAFPALSGAKTRMVPANFSDLAQQAKPGVVNIQTVKTIKGGGRVFRHFFGSPFGNQPGLDRYFLGVSREIAGKKVLGPVLSLIKPDTLSPITM